MFRYSLVTLTLCASAFAATTPKGLSTSAWSSIRSEYQRHRQAAFAVEGGWQARNYGQDWSTFFDGRGFEVKPEHGAWRWGLRLVSYGYQGQQRRVEKARAVAAADVEKFSYQWDSTIREWYVNGAGLEHGYTLGSRPGNGTGLRLHLEVLGTLQARVAGDGQGVEFLEGGSGGRPVLVNYGGLKVIDADGRQLAARFYGEAGGGLRLEIDDAGAKYPVTVDPVAQQMAYLKASNVEYFDFFGNSVAVSGDTVVVGAPFDSGNGINPAYVFTRMGGLWTQQASLKASNAAGGFGQSVAVSGDTMVVGAPYEASGNSNNQADKSASFSGAAYVFTRTNGVWTQQAYLKASNVGANDQFGYSVAVSGDTVVVGAFGEDSGNGSNQADNSATESGAAYVFARTSGVWTQQAYLKASNVGSGDRFGCLLGCPGTPWWWEPTGRTAPTAATRRTTAPPKAGRPTSSRAPAALGLSRPI